MYDGGAMNADRSLSSGLVWSITGLSGLMIGAGVLLWGMAIVGSGQLIGLLSHQLTTPFSGVIFAGLGGRVLSRHPRHPIAWMLAGLGLLTGAEVLNLGVLAYASLRAPGAVIPAPDLSHWLAQWIWAPRAMIPLTLFLLLFPDGKLPSRRWRPAAWAAAAGIVGSSTASAFEPGSWQALGGIVRNPYAVQSDMWTYLTALSSGLLTVSLLTSLASIVVRSRGARGVERQQLKWMVYAVAVVFILFLVTVPLLTAFGESRLAVEVAYSFVNLVSVCVAISVSVAVLRYRLYDIDLIINRTLVYGALTVLIVGLYVVIVGSLGATFQARGSLLISLVATGVIAVLFQPLRDRVQRTVNRLLYGERDEPYRVLSRLGRRLEGPNVPEAMLASIVGTIAQTLKLPYVAIAFPNSEGYEVVSETGKPTGDQVTLPLEYRGGRVGRLICSPRGSNEPFTDAERDLLRDIAVQAAVAVHALKLSAALQRSRERLVSAREEERRRLRRDLHDGLGPQLASLGFKIDAARNQLEKDPGAADAILLELRYQVKEAVGDIRRLTHDLRPPALDELGLVPALRSSAVAQFSSAGLRVDVDGPEDMPPLPAAVEVAAYRIVQEAVTNVARHAHAKSCFVRLRVDDGLELEVLDDGIGLPDSHQAGVGLKSMQERTAELGGRFHIEPRPQQGTRVVARFPLSDG